MSHSTVAAADDLDTWLAHHRIRQDRLSRERSVRDEIQQYMGGVESVDRSLRAMEYQRAWRETYRPLVWTLIVFLVGSSSLWVMAQRDFALYFWLQGMNRVETQLAQGLIQADAGNNSITRIRQSGPGAGAVAVKPSEDGHGAAYSQAHGYSRGRKRVYPLLMGQEAAGMPTNGTIFEVPGARQDDYVYTALWSANQAFVNNHRSITTHSNPMLQMLPNGDMLCSWFVNKSVYNAEESVRAALKYAVGRRIPPPPPGGHHKLHPPPPPPESARNELRPGDYSVMMVLVSRLPRGSSRWDTPYPVWETPSNPLRPSDGLKTVGGRSVVNSEERGIATDTSGGILVAVDHSVGELSSITNPVLRGQESQDAVDEAIRRSMELRYSETSNQVTLVLSAVSKFMPKGFDEKMEHALQVETVQVWGRPIELGPYGQAGVALRRAFPLLPDAGMYVRHRMLPSPLTSGEWLMPVHYMPAGLLDTGTHYSGVRWFVNSHNAADVDLTSGKGFAQISKIGVELVEPCLVWVRPDKGEPLLLAFMRSRGAHQERKIFRAESKDVGRQWSEPKPLRLPNFDRAFSAAGLPSGKVVIVFVNSMRAERWGPMSVALSADGGLSFPWVRDLDRLYDVNQLYSDPTVTVGEDGLIRIAYLWKAKWIRYISFTEKWVMGTWDGHATKGDYPHFL